MRSSILCVVLTCANFKLNCLLQVVLQSLPLSLQALEPEILMLLRQDETNIVAILNDDGTVNDWKLNQLRESIRAPNLAASGYRGENLYIDRAAYQNRYDDANMGAHLRSHQQSYSDVRNDYAPQRTRTRFSAPINHPNVSSIPYGDFSRNTQNDTSYSNRPLDSGWIPSALSNEPSYLDNNISYNSNSLKSSLNSHEFSVDFESEEAKKKRKFPSTKASTPCRFYNTPKGCQFGDKCAFGHFNDSKGATGMKFNTAQQSPKKSKFTPIETREPLWSQKPISNSPALPVSVSGQSRDKDEFGRDIR
ncbi:unnamed protein product [Sphagnum jensenii]|uniref:C3H1-type domain-containing protein n=1 Tax=Sphagnum jensenii TaxID=128206 RepID=A0ABP0VI42_9BRYO